MKINLNAVNNSMDCIFSIAHDRWLVIRTKDSSLCPIDNSTVKIRAAGKLYEPDKKYTIKDNDDDDVDVDVDDKNNTIKSVKFIDDNDNYKKYNNVHFNIANNSLKVKKSINNCNNLKDELLSSESTNDNDNSNDDKIELIMSKISDDILDIDDTEMDFDIIPPPSDFATDMIPLRKSKSAPAPFKKNQQGHLQYIISIVNQHDDIYMTVLLFNTIINSN